MYSEATGKSLKPWAVNISKIGIHVRRGLLSAHCQIPLSNCIAVSGFIAINRNLISFSKLQIFVFRSSEFTNIVCAFVRIKNANLQLIGINVDDPFWSPDIG